MASNMTTSTFHPFLHLPRELRAMIYDLTIEPRVVHVRERHECRAGFLERFRTSVVVANAPLHPHLAQFTCSARSSEWDTPDMQTTLDQYGFELKHNNVRAGPSKATPLKIDRSWLLEHPEVAWELMRRAALFSSAQLPVLLHAYAESRAYLKSQGYELAFATRSFPALTWFNFNIDSLYVETPFEQPEEDGTVNEPFFLSGSCWDVSQFEPSDLSRIKTLILAGEKQFPFWSGYDLETFGQFIDLFGTLKELHIAEWTPQNFATEIRSNEVESTCNNNDQCCLRCSQGEYPNCYKEYLSYTDDNELKPSDDDTLVFDEGDVELNYEVEGQKLDSSHCCLFADRLHCAANSTAGLSIYARDPWKIVAQEGIDSFLDDLLESHHVHWDLRTGIIDFSGGDDFIDFARYFITRQVEPYHHSVMDRFQEALAGVVKSPPQFSVSHVVPGNAILLGLKNLRRLKHSRCEVSDTGLFCKNCHNWHD